MTRINRRDYLKGIGAVAGTIASAGGLEVLAQHRHEIATLPDLIQQQPKDKFKVDVSKIYEQTGLRKYDLISSQSVKLIFSGLMAFFKDRNTCVVGFHSKENGKHRHHLRIRVYRIEADTCALMPPEIQVTPGTPMELKVIDPDVLNGVYYLNLPQLPDGTRHESDFRNVPDLEGPDWYKKDLEPQRDVYDPKLIVENGLFYTHKRTTSTFRRQTSDGNDVLEVGGIADYIGTNIYLKPGGEVKLTVGAQPPISLPQAAGVQYEIQFYNHCFNKLKSKDCAGEFKPYHLTDKTERNDFYMNYEALQNPQADEYLLVIAARGPRSAPEICGSPGRATDEAPCAGVGFGWPGGFPSFP
jgi:hypothetical protein